MCRNRRTVFPRFGCPRDKRITIKYTAREDDVVDIIFFEIASRSFYTQAAFLSTDDVLSLTLAHSLTLSLSASPPRGCFSLSLYLSLSLRTRVVCLYLWSFSSTVASVMSRTSYVCIYTSYSVSLQPHVYRSTRDGPVPFSPRDYTVLNIRRVRGPCLL